MDPLAALRRLYDSLPPPTRHAIRIGLGLAVVWAAWGLRVGWRRWRLQRRFGRARRLERRARWLLARRGYRVQAGQVERELALWVDGEAHRYGVRADYLVVDRRGRPFVAEVKSGGLASDPLHTPTRRQLLEYQLAYHETEGVLLVDMERRRIRRVRFPQRGGNGGS